jgi:nucleoside-diphosphate-sugar epimerase
MPHLLALGAGYSVRPLLPRLLGEGWTVLGTTRDEAKAGGLRSEGVVPLLWEAPAPLPEEAVSGADAIIVSLSPGADGCPALSALPEAALRPGVRLLYLSSSSVYGDHDGAWIDEDAACRPSTDRGRARLQAERGWQALAQRTGARLTLCRLAGIYGPGRNAVESLSGATRGARSGLAQRVVKEGQVFNRIHRDDIAAGLHALLQVDAPPPALNFADDEPSPPGDPVAYAARLLGLPPPPEVPFEEAEMSPMARSFYAENKRLRNERLKALPDFGLRYPTFREGLAALAESQRAG